MASLLRVLAASALGVPPLGLIMLAASGVGGGLGYITQRHPWRLA